MILGQQRTQPNNHYGFNLRKMQKQHFSLLFEPQKCGMGDIMDTVRKERDYTIDDIYSLSYISTKGNQWRNILLGKMFRWAFMKDLV